ncbi:hypothetical protein NHU_00888 [Rhodovulum sulfidophilum]|uniref:Phytanoyl-CoA dioxygenase n=1 Tax=Rhodovulum sulfidophilum TaxID=35806 RepID=A0A0D6AZI2_RHOSU|nr:hypothetical protein [Rhodovulum sulfidophilum]BAQ68055.1 hypothetical protein NHU_00888 [Rhodovulum sulfidophilum]
MKTVRYDLRRYDFRPWARRVLECEDLGALHKRPDPVRFDTYVKRMRHYTGRLEAAFEEIKPMYFEFVAREIAARFGELATVQTPPSIRCHLVGGGTGSSLHRDGAAKYNVTLGVINAWVPLTPVYGTASLFIETALGSNTLRSVTLDPGEMLFFDAFHLAHGSMGNRTETTRISFDLRFKPVDPERCRDLYVTAAPQRDLPLDRKSIVYLNA